MQINIHWLVFLHNTWRPAEVTCYIQLVTVGHKNMATQMTGKLAERMRVTQSGRRAEKKTVTQCKIFLYSYERPTDMDFLGLTAIQILERKKSMISADTYLSKNIISNDSKMIINPL